MKHILENLNREAGVAGSMVITPDGIMVSAALGPQFEEDRVAAIVSSLLVSVRRCLTQLKAGGKLDSCSLHASRGKIKFFDMEKSFLVVVAAPEFKFEENPAPVQAAIQRIKNRIGA